MATELLAAKSHLGPRFAISDIRFGGFLKIGQRVLTIVFRKKAKAGAEIFDRLRALVAAGRGDQLAERGLLRSVCLRVAIELSNSF